jgi:hypothetical protein
MSNEDKKYHESESVFVVDIPSRLTESAVERTIEEIVKKSGHLPFDALALNWGEKEVFAEDFSNLKKISEKYIKIFNPQKLSVYDYREAYAMGKLSWQKQAN